MYKHLFVQQTFTKCICIVVVSVQISVTKKWKSFGLHEAYILL